MSAVRLELILNMSGGQWQKHLEKIIFLSLQLKTPTLLYLRAESILNSVFHLGNDSFNFSQY